MGAGYVQALLGDLATQKERLQSLVNCEDPRATAFVCDLLFGRRGICIVHFRTVVAAFVITH